MKVEHYENRIELVHDNYMLVVCNDGTMLECITNKAKNSLRVDLTEKEKNFIDVLWKLFIYDHKKFKKSA